MDGGDQIIGAHDLTDCAADGGQVISMIDVVISNTGQTPNQASADSGFCSEINIQAIQPLPVAKTDRRTCFRPDQARRSFRQFLMRRIRKVTAEWAMLCTVHNILKLASMKAVA